MGTRSMKPIDGTFKRFCRNAAIGVVWLTIACTSPGFTDSGEWTDVAELRFIAAPSGGEYGEVTWLSNTSELIVNYRPSQDNAWSWKLHTIRLDGSGFEPLPIPDDPECKHTSHHLPRALADGRLAYVQKCWASRVRNAQNDTALMVYDPASKSSESLLPYYLPHGTRSFDLNPDAQNGILMAGSLLFNDLYWIYPDKLDLLILPVELPGNVSWSPDGQFVALNAVPEGLQAEGPDRLLLPEKLYLLSVGHGDIWPIADGFVSAGVAAWSPDSRWVMLPVKTGESTGTHALWVIEARTGKRCVLLPEGKHGYSSVAWLSDGQTFVRSAFYDPDEYPVDSRYRNGLQIFRFADFQQCTTILTSAK